MRIFLALGTGVLLALFPITPLLAEQSGSDPLFVDVQPSSPAPGEQTTITIDSSTFNVGQAAIRWIVNGSPAAAGNGARTVTFTMGPGGKTTVVELTVAPLHGTPFTRTFTFRPGLVTLLWEADTYVPPFFTSKSLYTPGATIRVQAVTDIRDAAGNQISPSDLTFKWEMGGDAFADRSGLGRDTVVFDGSLLGGVEEVGVDVLRKDGSLAARQAAFIKDSNPVVLLYKKDPLRGTLYSRALIGEVPVTEAETTIVAEPYYISSASRNNKAFVYRWNLNDEEITPQGADPAVLTLRQTGAQTGKAVLALSIQNTDVTKLLQAADTMVTLLLKANDGNFFGF